MAIRQGNIDIEDIKVGSKDVEKVYQGIDMVWPKNDVLSYEYTFNVSDSIQFGATGGNKKITIVSRKKLVRNGVPEGDFIPVPYRLDYTGPFTIDGDNVIASNNTSEEVNTGIVKVIQDGTDDELTVNVSQEAGVKVYETPVIDRFYYDERDASGGTLTPAVRYSQAYTWNGVAGSGGTVTSGATMNASIPTPVEGASVNSSNGIVTWTPNYGGARRVEISMFIQINGKTSATLKASARQNADEISYYGDIDIKSLSVEDIPAKGGEIASGVYEFLQHVYYVSGRITDITSGAVATYSNPVVVPTLGINIKDRTKVGDLTLTLALNGKSSNKTVDVYQQANVVTNYSELSEGSISAADIPAKGGTEAATTTMMVQTVTYTSTATRAGNVTVAKTAAITGTSLGTTIKDRTKLGDVTATFTGEGGKTASKTVSVYQQANAITDYSAVTISGGSVADIPARGGEIAAATGMSASQTITYTSTATRAGNISLGYSTKISASSLGTTIKARTKIGTLTATYTGEGNKTASKAFDVYQQANAITIYGDLTGGGISAADIPAAGGERTATITNMAQVITYTSGATRAGSVSNTQTAKVTGSSLGTTVKARTKLGSITATFTGEGSKTATKSVDVYQAANNATYGALTGGNVTAADIPASGGTRTATVTNMTQTVSYTSGATRAGTVTNTQTAAISGSSLGTTAKARTKLGSITVSFTGEGSKTGSKAVDVYQAANAITTYGNVTISNGTVADIPASGGERTSASGMTATQTITYTSGATRAGSVSIAWSTKVSGSSLGTTAKARTKLGTLTATVTGEGSKSATKAFDVYQAANTATYANPTVNMTYGDISAGGSTVTPSVSFSQGVTWTSGGKSTVTSGGTKAFSGTSVNTTTGAVTAATLGTTAKARTKITTSTVTITVNGKTGSKAVDVYQAANAITGYANPVVNLSYSTIGAAGGTVNPSISYSQTITYTSGATKQQTTGGTITYTGASNNTNGAVTASSKGSTVSGVTTVKTVTATVALNGKSGSKSVAVSQAANSVTYGNPTVNLSYGDIGAGGGSVTPSVSFSQSVSYTSGSTATVTSGGTKSFSGTGVNTSTGAVSASSLGTTAKARTSITTATVSITVNGKSGSKQATVYQAANAITSYSNVTISGGSVSDIPAKGGSVSSASGISASQTITYTSGSTRSGSVSIKYSTAVSASNLTTTVKARTKIGTLTATASGEGSKSATKAFDVYQQANSRTVSSTSGGTYTYGNVSAGSISNKTIPASGGSATATAGNGSQRWSRSAVTTNYSYTSGSTSSAVTEAATSGSNAISPSISSISATASSRGTTTGSQTTVKSQNVTWSGNGGKSASGTMYIYQQANSRSSTGTSGGTYTYENVVAGSISNKTIPASGGSATATAGNGSQRWSRSAITTHYSYTSGSTSSKVTSAATSGTDTIYPSTSSINATAGSKGTTVSEITTVKSQNVTWSGGGSKSASGTMYIYQAANAVTSTTTGTWTVNISASPTSIANTGGTSTITASASAPKTNHYTSGATAGAGNATATPTLSGSASGFTLSGRKITAGENPNASSRSITVTATSNGVSKSVTVTQAASSITWDYELSVSPSSLSFEAAGGTKTVSVVSRRQKMLNGKATGVYENVAWTAS